MAPIPFQHPVRFAPLALVGSHLGLVVYLVYAVGASLYTSYKSLGPAQDTRSRLAQRKRLAPIFLGLAVASFSLATYSAIASATLSYKTWAYEHGLDLPSDIWHHEVFAPEAQNLYLSQWLSDAPIYLDAAEIVVEKARRFWWSQQIDLATMAFGLLLSIEGRRRKIPMLSSFMALAHLVNLSFAQNLFCLALLLTPSPLPSGDEDLELPVVPLPSSRWLQLRNTLAPPKPKNWTPHASIFFSSVILHLAAIFFLPYAAQTASFMTVALSVRTSTFLPLILPKVVPVRWGTTHKHPSSAYDLFSTVFRYTSTPSFVLYVKASLVALCTNAPDSHYHRHSIFIPWDLEKRSKWERSTTALGKVLGSASDHPVVAAVAWDVLICTLSLGLWAAVRSTDIQDMTNCAVPYASKRPVPQIESMGAADKTDSVLGDDAVLEHENSMTPRRSHRARKSRFGSVNSSASEDIASSTGSATPYTRGRRGRSKKTQQEPEEERAYEPSPTETKDLVEGDTLPPKELDWESAAFAWGVAALSGLASASAGVFGAECVSR